jgi:hypothetical protein
VIPVRQAGPTCHAACIASILQRPLDDVLAYGDADRWLELRGLELKRRRLKPRAFLTAAPLDYRPDLPEWIGIVDEAEDGTHAVVCRGWHVVHDPGLARPRWRYECVAAEWMAR